MKSYKMTAIVCAAAGAGARTVIVGATVRSSAPTACFTRQCSNSLSVTSARRHVSRTSPASFLSTTRLLSAATTFDSMAPLAPKASTKSLSRASATVSPTACSSRHLCTARTSTCISGYTESFLAGMKTKACGTRTTSKLLSSLDDASPGTGTRRTLKTSSKQGKISAKEKGGPKRYKSKHKGLLRADRILSNRGVGTRSHTFKLLRSRRISILDPDTGKLVAIKGPSEKIAPDSMLYLDGNELPGPPPLILIYHKPKFVLSAMDDNGGRDHLGEKLEQRYVTAGMHPVGRLDYETTGLILFSLSGDLTQRLLHPRRCVEKEYIATVEGAVDEEVLREKLETGVETSEGTHVARLLEVTHTPHAVSTEVDSEKEGRDVDASSEVIEAKTDRNTEQSAPENCDGQLTDVRLVVTEGKHRMVRRMLANCGHPVVELRRERHGIVRLENLPVGKFRHPTKEEVEWAESLLT